MDTCICMAGSLCFLPEAVTTLLIGDTPIENKKLKKKKNFTFGVIREENLKSGSGSSPVEPDPSRSATMGKRVSALA